MTDGGAPLPGLLVSIPSGRGEIKAMWRPVPEAHAAVLLVGGIDGGFDGPAEALYPTLAGDLAAAGVASLRLDFRVHSSPGDMDHGTHDVLVGVAWLETQGIRRVALVGHSFGAAVVINAGAQHPNAAAVATLSAQTFGARLVNRLSPRPLLLVHGSDDDRLPPSCSQYLYARALEPKELIILEGARHSLRQRRADLRALLAAWLIRTLGEASGAPG